MSENITESHSDDGAARTHAAENRKLTNSIQLPLAQQQVKILQNAIPDNVDVGSVIGEIEALVKKTDPETLYNEVSAVLHPLVGEKTRQILGMLFMYKKRPCREGDYCTKGPRCIFLHENEKVSMDARPKRRLDAGDSVGNKRFNVGENREVIFNKIPFDLADDAHVLEYANKYGIVQEVKRLNEGKYLIRFEDPKSAQDLVDSQEPVLDAPVITKFFNVMPTRQEETLDTLFSDQQEALNNIYRSCSNKEHFSRLKYVCLKIQRKVEEMSGNRTKGTKETRPTFGGVYVDQSKQLDNQ